MIYFLKLALRSASHNLHYASLSVSGLCLGFCAVILIGLYVNDELSYESWLPGYEDVYRVSPHSLQSLNRAATAPSELGLWLRTDFPQIESMARLFNSNSVVINPDAPDQRFNEIITWSDSSVFDIFQFPVLEGSLEGAIDETNSIVITAEIAEKYFGEESALGQVLVFDDEISMRVSAVIADHPSNTVLTSQIFSPGHAVDSPLAEQDRNPIGQYFGSKLWASQTFVRVPAHESVDAMVAQLPAMLDRHLPMDEGLKNSEIYGLEFIPLKDIHLTTPDATVERGELRTVYTVIVIALLILGTAVINYVNLMTARANRRAPEIAIRKTLGASPVSLIQQFMTESALYVSLSAAIAGISAYLLLAPLNAYLEREIAFASLLTTNNLLIALAILLLTILAAGLYPAFVLSRFSPLSLFQARKPSTNSVRLRAVLSMCQFALLTGLLISAWTIHSQAQFGINSSLALIDDPIVLINSQGCDDAIMQRVDSLPGVTGSGCATQIPQFGMGWGTSMERSITSDDETQIRQTNVSYVPVDFDFLQLFDYELLAGRFFVRERAGDLTPANNEWVIPQSIIVNETLVRALGFENPEDAVGSLVEWGHVFQLPNVFTPPHDAEIIGVLEDFQVGNIRNEIPAAAFYVQPGITNFIGLKIEAASLLNTVDQLDTLWEEMDNTGPLNRQFLDQSINQMYDDLSRQSQLLAVYSGIAIVIAILGLVGLAGYIAEKRTKEIGIRKVLGGTRAQIIAMLLLQFSKPVVISNLLAWPAAYYILNRWLNGFASHIELGVSVFVLAALITLLLAIGTVFTHAWLVARRNPVAALRYE